MNFQERNRTVYGMVRQQTIPDLEQEKVQVCFKKVEEIK